MSDLRTAAQQVLEAMEAMQSYAAAERKGLRICDEAIPALRAALAQQAEPLNLRDPAVQKRLATQWGYVPAAQAEPVEPVNVGLLEYRGNSVAFIYQKMTAYRAGIDAAWDALRAKGLHPDGKTSLADMIAKHTAPPRRTMVPLTEEDIRKYADKHLRYQPESYEASGVFDLIRAIEKASWEKNNGQA